MAKQRVVTAGLITALTLAITGCGGSDDDTSPSTNSSTSNSSSDTTAPITSSITPADSATEVATNSTVTATFNEDLLASTITNSSFTLSNGDGAVSGTASYDAITKVATFTPSRHLKMMDTFTANLTADITDLSGNAYTASSWSFSTGDGTWGTTSLLETDDTGAATNIQLAVDGSDNVFAVWGQSDGTRYNLMASRYAIGTGWSLPELIETDDNGNTSSQQIAADSNGNAIAVWHQWDGTRDNLWANRYTAGTGWGTAALLETDDTSHAQEPQIAMESNGDALVIWKQDDGSRYNIYSKRYTAGTGWGSVELVETVDSGDAGGHTIAMDANGNAIAAMMIRTVSRRYDLWANRYTNGTGWGTAELIETTDLGDANWPQVAFDSSGNAMAVWYQNNGTAFDIWANRYVAGTGWGTAEKIEADDTNTTRYPDVAMDSNGNAIAVWYQHDGTLYNIMANRYVAGTGWGTAGLIETDDNGHAGLKPQVIMDAAGNAIAGWRQHDGTSYNLYYNRYLAGSGWGTATLLENDDTGTATGVRFVMDSNDAIIAGWYQSDGSYYSTYSRRFE